MTDIVIPTGFTNPFDDAARELARAIANAGLRAGYMTIEEIISWGTRFGRLAAPIGLATLVGETAYNLIEQQNQNQQRDFQNTLLAIAARDLANSTTGGALHLSPEKVNNIGNTFIYDQPARAPIYRAHPVEVIDVYYQPTRTDYNLHMLTGVRPAYEYTGLHVHDSPRYQGGTAITVPASTYLPLDIPATASTTLPGEVVKPTTTTTPAITTQTAPYVSPQQIPWAIAHTQTPVRIPIPQATTDIPKATISVRPYDGTIPRFAAAQGVTAQTRVNTKAIDAVYTESHTLRKDTKSASGMAYLAALRFINKTWGKLTELDDAQLVLQKNLKFADDSRICIGSTCINVKAGQSLHSLPVKYKIQALKEISKTGMDKFDFDGSGFLQDFARMELSDRAIGLASRIERGLIRDMGIHGLLDYGNFSTWLSRAGLR